MEHLFKLKKDGKTVGYMHLFGAYAHYKVFLDEENWRSQRLFENLPEVNTSVTTLTAHPFVTKDKNGKGVFAGDEVDSMGNRCCVMWHKVFLQWTLWHIEGDYYFGQVSKKDIELSEEKEDD